MRALKLLALFLLATVITTAQASTKNKPDGIQWQGWTPDLFEKAKKENRFVILDLEAVWCHWCHVMEEKTYQDKQVIELIKSKYIAVRVDQDASPDLSSRYGDWGWPATIVFAPDGTEIVKRQGYINPIHMASMLQAIIDDPSPGPSVLARAGLEIKASKTGALSGSQVTALMKAFNEVYDKKQGGWGSIHKYLDRIRIEIALREARTSTGATAKKYETMARHTLNQAQKLIDPEWGGIYQYSDKLDWSSPHFEKIISFQAAALRTWSLGYATLGDASYKASAEKIFHYLVTFMLSPEGAFYVSQDADLNSDIDGHKYFKLDNVARRKLGIPRIDKNLYARENGWMIAALADFYSFTGNQKALGIATRALQWSLKNRQLPSGGFRHGKVGNGQFLGDSLYMTEALLQMYTVTGRRDWLKQAERSAKFIEGKFRDMNGGYMTALVKTGAVGVFTKPVLQPDENIDAARIFARLHNYTGNKAYKKSAQHALKLLAAPSTTKNQPWLSGVILADYEISLDPVHITIVGAKNNASSKSLFKAAIKYPASYRRIEWWDIREGDMPNSDIRYPQLSKPAAFACANNACSLPVLKEADIAKSVDRLMGVKRK